MLCSIRGWSWLAAAGLDITICLVSERKRLSKKELERQRAWGKKKGEKMIKNFSNNLLENVLFNNTGVV